MQAWPVVVFGAPLALVALAVCVGGLLHERPWWLALGGVGLVPSSIYLGGHPGAGFLFLLPLFPWLAAIALHRGRRLTAGFLVVPSGAAVLWLATLVVFNLMAR